MKKKLLAMLLAAGLLTSNAAATNTYTPLEKTADALNHLGLLAGTGTSYDLDAPLRRDAGITLLVKMLGKEAEATSGGDFGMPFTDVPDWAKGFAGYAWANKITSGVSATEFGSEMAMTDYMFLTLTLHALGYVDTGDNPQFVWNNPYIFAHSVGLIDSADPDEDFTRGDAVEIFWNAMDVKFNGSETTLSQSLIEQGVFTAQAFEKAEQIQEQGRARYQGVPAQPEEDEEDEDPVSKPETPVEPEKPAEPETPVEPEQPSEPETPVEPEQPSEPETPVEPEQPSEPETPVEPEQPSEPETPVEPEKPAEPETPVEPEKPAEPETPVEPEKPAEPETPVEPEQPAEPETPVEPEQPAEPETPVEPEQPAEPETPVEPELPAEPEGSGGTIGGSADVGSGGEIEW